MTTSNTLEKGGGNKIQLYTHTKLKRIFQSSWATRLVSPHAYAGHSSIRQRPATTHISVFCMFPIHYQCEIILLLGLGLGLRLGVRLESFLLGCLRYCCRPTSSTVIAFACTLFISSWAWSRAGTRCQCGWEQSVLLDRPAAVAVTAVDTKVHVIGLMDISVLTQFC